MLVCRRLLTSLFPKFCKPSRGHFTNLQNIGEALLFSFSVLFKSSVRCFPRNLCRCRENWRSCSWKWCHHSRGFKSTYNSLQASSVHPTRKSTLLLPSFPPEDQLGAKFEVTSYTEGGIDDIKTALRAGLEVLTQDEKDEVSVVIHP